MEEGLAGRLVQVGIRTLSQHLREQVARFGVEVHEMWNLDIESVGRDFDGPVYLSIDLDALDPAYAPGVSHHEPGGMSVRDVLGIIQQLPNEIVCRKDATRQLKLPARLSGRVLRKLSVLVRWQPPRNWLQPVSGSSRKLSLTR